MSRHEQLPGYAAYYATHDGRYDLPRRQAESYRDGVPVDYSAQTRHAYAEYKDDGAHAEKLEFLVHDAVREYAVLHDGLEHGTMATAMARLLQQAATDMRSADETQKKDDDLGPTLRVVVMTDAEHEAWLWHSGLAGHAYSRHPAGWFGTSVLPAGDWLQPLRQGLVDAARTVKKLELRLGVASLVPGIEQQHTLETAALEAQFFAHKRLGASEEPDAFDSPASADVLVTRLAREAATLVKRLDAVEAQAAMGVRPLCHHALDLGTDAATDVVATEGDVLATMPRVFVGSVLDPRTAHTPTRPGREQSVLRGVDIARGFGLAGLAAHVVYNHVQQEHTLRGLTPRALCKRLYERCGADVRAMLGDTPTNPPPPNPAQPTSLLQQWARLVDNPYFVQVQLEHMVALQNRGRRARHADRAAKTPCPCIARTTMADRDACVPVEHEHAHDMATARAALATHGHAKAAAAMRVVRQEALAYEARRRSQRPSQSQSSPQKSQKSQTRVAPPSGHVAVSRRRAGGFTAPTASSRRR